MTLVPADITIEALKGKVGQEIGTSPWIAIPQDKINQFADVTGDHQFIHVDLKRAAETPFGGTIAHGFLTLSLLAHMADETLPKIADTAMGINYGFEEVRFLNPVRAGKRVRGKFVLADLTQKTPKDATLKHAVTVEIEGETKPALAAEWLTMVLLK
jgi:acyl dehydratase